MEPFAIAGSLRIREVITAETLEEALDQFEAKHGTSADKAQGRWLMGRCAHCKVAVFEKATFSSAQPEHALLCAKCFQEDIKPDVHEVTVTPVEEEAVEFAEFPDL